MNLHIHPGEPCTQLMSLPHSAVKAELHATSKASAILRSDIQRRHLGLRFPLIPLEFFDSVYQRLVNFVDYKSLVGVVQPGFNQKLYNGNKAKCDHSICNLHEGYRKNDFVPHQLPKLPVTESSPLLLFRFSLQSLQCSNDFS